MGKTDIDSKTQAHGLKNTPFRNELLNLFHKARASLMVEEIKNMLKTSKDKVTIYRALEAFEQNGLIHRVPDSDNLIRYALCQSGCDKHHHRHNHAHFICNICNETYCMDHIKTPEVEVVDNFKVLNSKLTLEGICSYCQEKNTI